MPVFQKEFVRYSSMVECGDWSNKCAESIISHSIHFSYLCENYCIKSNKNHLIYVIGLYTYSIRRSDLKMYIFIGCYKVNLDVT